MTLGIYAVDGSYMNSHSPMAPHLFHNSTPGQPHSRKNIGIVLEMNGFEHFAPLCSFKPKNCRMKNSLDLIKVRFFAVINLNCMLPATEGSYRRVDFSRRQTRDIETRWATS